MVYPPWFSPVYRINSHIAVEDEKVFLTRVKYEFGAPEDPDEADKLAVTTKLPEYDLI